LPTLSKDRRDRMEYGGPSLLLKRTRCPILLQPSRLLGQDEVSSANENLESCIPKPVYSLRHPTIR
jgi:hypothetical protein